MTREQASNKVDRMLDEVSLLHYGLPYAKLSASKQCKMILEALQQYDPRLLEIADSLTN